MKWQSTGGGVEGFERTFVSGKPRLFAGHLHAPLQIVEEAKRPSFIGPLGARVPCSHSRADGLQLHATGRQREQLSVALIGEAVHPNAAIRTGKAGGPRDAFSTVSNIIGEQPKTSLGRSAAADVLNDDNIAVSSVPGRVRIDDRRSNTAAVGLAH